MNEQEKVSIDEESFIFEDASSSAGCTSNTSSGGQETAIRDPYVSLVSWISLVLIKLKMHFNISNKLADLLIIVFAVFLSCLSHPIHKYFPSSFNSMLRRANIDRIDSVLYVVCPSSTCSTIYPVVDGILPVNVCTSTHYSKRCGESLVYEKKLSFGKVRSTPHKTFTFIPTSIWLKKMFAKDEFVSLLSERMRNRPDDGVLYDVWDGKMWKSFMRDPLTPTQPFLEKETNLAFMLNVDWVKPFVRGTYSIGAIYMTVLNLPRRERFREKWSCLIGLMPGPVEPKQHMNTYLKPLVDDLLSLWDGIPMKIKDRTETVRAALICVSCDLPASRKVSQFLGHKADFGCGRCKFQGEREREKETGQITGRMSYYSKSTKNFENRDPEQVRQQAMKWLAAPNANQAKNIAKSTGVRYSELLRLPYFDLPRMCVVDPMHAFLLGLVETETDLHISDETDSPLYVYSVPLSKRKEFRKRLKETVVPSDIGRLPVSLPEKKTLSSLTAEQWKNYSLLYARPCLLDLLPDRPYCSMKLLCEVIEIVVQNYLTKDNLEKLEELLEEHHHLFASIYGKWKVSINYHQVLHMTEIFEDFGPSPVFWCFAFERLNGLIVDAETNRRSLEVQLTEAFVFNQSLKHLKETTLFPLELHNEPTIDPLLKKIESFSQDTNRLLDAEDKQIQRLRASKFFCTDLDKVFNNQLLVEREEVDKVSWSVEMLPPKRSAILMNGDMYALLKQHFKDIYQDDPKFVSARITKWARCRVNGTCFSSDLNRTDRSATVTAYWAINEAPGICKYYGRVRFFFDVDVIAPDGSQKVHKMAYVDWAMFHYKDHGRHQPSGLVALKKSFYKSDHFISVRRLINRVLMVPYKNMILVEGIP